MTALDQKQFIMKYISIDNAVIRRLKPIPVQSIFLKKEKRRPKPVLGEFYQR